MMSLCEKHLKEKRKRSVRTQSNMRFSHLSGILILCVLTCGISIDEHTNRGLNSMMNTIVPEVISAARVMTAYGCAQGRKQARTSEGSVELETVFSSSSTSALHSRLHPLHPRPPMSSAAFQLHPVVANDIIE